MPFTTHWDGRGPVPSSSFWFYLRFTRVWLFYFGVMTISHWLLGPLGEKVHFDKVSFPESLPVLCAKHMTWNAVFAHLNLTSFECNVTVPFLPVRKIFKSNISRRRMGPLQGKVIGDSFPVNQNSKTGIGEPLKEEAGPCWDHVFLFLEVGRPPWPHRCRESSLETKGELCQGCSTQTPFR